MSHWKRFVQRLPSRISYYVVDLHKLQRQKHNAQQHITKTLTYSTNGTEHEKKKWWTLYETIGSCNAEHNGKLDTRISHCVIAVGFVIIANAECSSCFHHSNDEHSMLPKPNEDGEISRSQHHRCDWRTHRNKCRTIEMRFLQNVKIKSNAAAGNASHNENMKWNSDTAVIRWKRWGVCVWVWCNTIRGLHGSALKMANPIII